MTAQIKICICFSLVTHFPSIWVTNKSRICLCNIQRKHLSCPSQVYTNNLLLSNMFDSGCSFTKPLSDRNMQTHQDLPQTSPTSFLSSSVFLLHDSVFVLTCFNPLGVRVFLKKCWILTSRFRKLVAWQRLKIEIYCKLEKCWAWPKVNVGCTLWRHHGAALLNFTIFRK